MKQFACGDVVPGCGATFTGADDEQILGLVGRHAHHDHGLTEVSDELVAAVKSHIRVA